MAEQITDADREYAIAWMDARGKRPSRDSISPGMEYWWNRLGSGTPHSLPRSIFMHLPDPGPEWSSHPTEAAAIDALALAIKIVKADVAVPGRAA